MRGGFVATVLVSALAVLGCGENKSDAGVAAQREQWERQDIDSYGFDFRWNCFCPPERTDEVHVTVTTDAITSVRRKADGQELGPEAFSRYETIDGLFALLQRAVDAEADEIRVEYDPARGFPTSAMIDYEAQAADEELGFQVTAFQPLP